MVLVKDAWVSGLRSDSSKMFVCLFRWVKSVCLFCFTPIQLTPRNCALLMYGLDAAALSLC